MIEPFQTFSLITATVLFDSLWQGAILFALAWAAIRLLRNAGATTRYMIWFCTLLALGAVPLGTVVLTPRAAPASGATAHVDVPRNASAEQPAISEPVLDESASSEPVYVQAAVNPQITVPQAVVIGVASLWFIVAATRTGFLIWNFIQLARIQRAARLWSTRRAFPVWISDCIGVPLAIGFTRPGVYLPAQLLREETDDTLEAIVVHEIAHLRRRDVWTNAIARFVEACLALNPIAWLLVRQLGIEREIACDDSVVMHLGSGDVFARALAALATSHRRGTQIAAPSAIGSAHSIVTRIERLLDAHPRRLRLSISALGGVLMFFALVAMLMQTISPVLAYSTNSGARAPVQIAASCATPDAPVLMKGYVDTSHGRKTLWIRPFPVSTGVRFRGAQNIAVLEVTVDAAGKPRDVKIVSSPDEKGAQYAARHFEQIVYRPAVKNCVNVSSTFRTWYPVRSNAPEVYSIVTAAYPEGWSKEHPSACRVPDLIHGGVPSTAGLQLAKGLTASIRVTVNSNGDVSGATVAKSSGNAAFDNDALDAARNATYPLNGSSGFKPVRPSGADLSWNASHGYSAFSKCRPLPTQYVWTATFKPAGSAIFAH